MASNKTPLLENGKGGSGEEKKKGWEKVVDFEEAKMQICFSVPMILTSVSYYCITLISVMFAGHLGDLELAASTLANSWVMGTGLALMTGLSGALETLCGQGYGAKLYRMMGIYLQSSIIIAFFFSLIVSVLWFYSEPILILLHQEPPVSKMAALYMKHLIPGLFAYGFLQCILRFLQTQTVIIPLVVCSVVPLVVHVGITYTMISHTPLGFRAAPLAASISLWISFLMLALYVNYADKFKHTWEGFSMECFRYVLPSLKLAIPSAVMVCLEYWAFEYLVLIAGLMPTSERSTSLIAMCVNTEAVTYMITYGFSAAVSTRVSNELGAGNANRAKNAIAVTLKLSIFLALTVILALAFGHNIWASSFTNSPIIKREFASMTPLLAISILFDSAQGILSGVSRGCGWQHLAAWTNLAAFYGIGMPIAVLLGFKMGLYAKGLWIGLICGLSCQACTLLVITVRTKWEKINLSIENGKAQSVLV
ncbi:protein DETOXIFICATION 19-like isoform X1 [Macadamia integrifolia]|uniref:protein DETOXIFICATION 19-like isoform X1 n=1 Tax=Macadamia integrifolia TaxID=60698 RepID=UPI001C4E8830|nr:protein DETOXIFICATION 19-like isoform X1 [Macadamia integrifolia]XP_042512346.1 protein DETOXIFICATION 19-like isoform X1 [Macadamia integrifolia]